MSNRHVGNSGAGAAAEGRIGSLMGEQIAASSNLGGESTFRRFLVEEVVFDPVELDEDRIASIREKYGISEGSFLNEMPANTLIGKLIGQTTSGHERHHYLFPFFPPHLMLPVKAGEHVWVFFEAEKAIDHGFWVCRINEPRHVDDVNHTHADRKFHATERVKTSKDKFEEAPDKTPTFDNGPTYVSNGEIVSSRIGSSASDGDPKAYEKILKESDSGKISEMESVPTFRKRPGDAVLQGSNNAIIVVGTDRTGRSAKFTKGDNGKEVTGKPDKDQTGGAGAIDIVVGRGQTEKTAPKKLTNSLGKEERSKRIADENVSEGDPDFLEDAGRFYISMKTDPDNNFEINFSERVASGEPASVLKTDHVRIIARKTVKFILQSAADAPESECAGILIKDGNVILIPAENGYLKLGGENANKAILTQPTGVTTANGKVTAIPIKDTMGAQSGLGAENGEFASKILVV